MPLRRISSKDAIENLRRNLFGSWPSREDPDTNRIEPICKPAFSPTFRLDHDDQIFTIGSCFAREVEKALSDRGFSVATSKLAWPDNSGDPLTNEVLNSYGVTSIENELRWALDPDHPFDPAKHFLEVLPGRYLDPNIPSIRPTALGTILGYRKAITEVTRRVTDCRVVVMTLGLSEVWFDNFAQTYLNVSPSRMFMTKNPARFELHVLDVHETLRALQNAIMLLKKHCRDDQRILLTVSPVPLVQTYTAEDALVANGYSKAVLRTAAEHVAQEHAHIDYFPSYESVTLSERSQAWEDDQIHVQRRLIQINVERMIEAYKPQARSVDLAEIASCLAAAKEEIEVRNVAGAIHILEPLRDFVHVNVDAATLYADLCLRAGRPKDALTVLAKVPSDEGLWQRDLTEARAALLDGHTEQGLSALTSLAERYPARAILHRVLTDAYCNLGRWDDALLAALNWNACKGVAKFPDALGRIAYIHAARGDAPSAEAAYQAALNIALNIGSLRSALAFDFIEFLIRQKRFDEAAGVLETVVPETKAAQWRYDRLRVALPTVKQTERHSAS